METAFRVLLQTGPLAALAGIVATILVYFVYPRGSESRLTFWRYLGYSIIAGLIGYGAGTAIGIGIACSTPRGGNLCGLMGIFGVGPLLAGISMFAYACYQIATDGRAGGG
jgi:hypothetical protein